MSTQDVELAGEMEAGAHTGLAASDVESAQCPAPGSSSDAHGEDLSCCAARRSRLWRTVIWSSYFNLFVCLPRMIILPGMFINIVRGPVYGFFLHPLWAMLYCAASLVLVLSKDDPLERVLMDPCGIFDLLEQRCGVVSTVLLVAQEAVTTTRKRAVVLNLIWTVIDWILTVLTFGVSLGFCLIVFTETDGLVTSGFQGEYAVLLVGVIFCAMSVACESVMITSMVMFLCTTIGPAPAERVRDIAPQTDKSPGGAALENDATGISEQLVQQENESVNNEDLKLKDLGKSINSCAVYFVVAILISTIILLSFCIHDSIRGKYYQSESSAEYESCDGLVPIRCALPFPSSFWLEEDTGSATGYKVSIGRNTLPYLWKGEHMNPEIMNRYDGFSVSAPILWHLDDVRSADLVSFEYVERSVLKNSSTLIVRMDTLDAHPHFTETDHLDDDPNTRILYSVPATALQFNTTYIVIVQGLSDESGNAIKPSGLWDEFREAYATGDTSAISDMDRYDRYTSVIFPALEAMNISIKEVQLAWDFHTASFASISNRLLTVTDMAALRTQQELDSHGGLPYELVQFEEEDCSAQTADSHKMSAIAYYRVSVPWFLVSTDRLGNDIDPSLLSLPLEDDDSIRRNVPIKGSVGLLIQVPCSLTEGFHKNVSSIVEFGHGIFGNRGIATDDWLQRSANTQGWLVWSADWRGLSTVDVLSMWRLATHDIMEFKNIEAAVTQAFASKTALRMILPTLLKQEASKLGLTNIASLLEPEGAGRRLNNIVPEHRETRFRRQARDDNSLDTAKTALSGSISIQEINNIETSYIGHSMGAIIGTSWAILTGYARSAQIAGGSPFTFVMGRSAAFSLLKLAFDLQFYNRADIRIGITSWQCGLDIFESSGWAYSDRLEGVSILSLNVLGDATVSGLGSQILAANINASLLEPSVTTLALVPLEQSPIIGTSAKIMFQALSTRDHEKIAKNSDIPASNEVHNCLLYEDSLIQLHNEYISGGESTNPCGDDACVFPGYMHCNQ